MQVNPKTGLPPAQGLYDPQYEKDACGVGFIVNIKGGKSHQIIKDAETMLRRMKHRGACGCDETSGDGAGILTGIPHKLYARLLRSQNVELPPLGQYATGILFLDKDTSETAEAKFTAFAEEHGMKVLCWRDVAVDKTVPGSVAQTVEPRIRQVFITSNSTDQEVFRRQIYLLRKLTSRAIPDEGLRFYLVCLSLETVVYKGQLTPKQLWQYYTDLQDSDYETHIALVHSRFSTNTFPSWERAHPHRYLAHNGEINTLRGNENLMRAREGVMMSSKYGDKLKLLYPVVEADMPDSAKVDNVLEFLITAGGRSLPEAVMTMVPEAWQNDPLMTPEKKDFYRWAAFAMEPWDGPALLTFSDGRYVGAILDRNGLRPSRYYITNSGYMIMASEVGVLDVPHQDVLQKGRLQPGRMLLVDTVVGEVTKDEELKLQIARQRPVGKWLQEQAINLQDLYNARAQSNSHEMKNGKGEIPSVQSDLRLPLFGYSLEHLNLLLVPYAKNKKEALGSMGNDAPLACLSKNSPLMFEYFKQLFAQVTNPPIDPIRESIVMSLACPVGPEANILEPSEEQCRRLFLQTPILTLHDLEVIKTTDYKGWKTKTIDMTFPVTDGAGGLIPAIDRICADCSRGVEEGYRLLVLSDRQAGQDRVPVSSLMSIGAVHHHLIKTRQRLRVGLILETGEAREMHHFCVLVGFGADAVCPYLLYESLINMNEQNLLGIDVSEDEIQQRVIQAANKGISKVMAKMGISTLHSYKGAQIFEAVGLSKEVVDKCFVGCASRLNGVDFKVLAEETIERHGKAYRSKDIHIGGQGETGAYHWRDGGEKHVNDPQSIAFLQDATRNKNKSAYEKYSANQQESVKACTLRGQLDFKFTDQPLDISEVEAAANIVKRFVTGAMSFGSLSIEAHSTLARAMNRIGAKSNTGEGGEDADRYLTTDRQNSARSAIKQVASGRFGVTSAYLANADELQIKMAQGAKPGEGGELPGYKVTKDIAFTRHSVPWVGLISPPPHHDIYSIEDLAELIYNLKCANPKARISVKLVSEVGVGVIAAGVAKGKAEHITISGHDGGTGASTWTGIKHAGLPWELGIAETHQTLVINDLRSRVTLQTDGQLRTGRDVVIAAMLGADEFAFSTAPLIAMGCTMMRKCHLNTCPVGVATQDPELRKKFEGQPEHVVNFFFMLAEEIRSYMAKLGFRTFQDMIGRSDMLKAGESLNSQKGKMLNFEKVLLNALDMRPGVNIIGGSIKQDFELEQRLDNHLIAEAQSVINGTSDSCQIKVQAGNTTRAFATTLSFEVAKKYGDEGLPDNSISIEVKGHGGQSFCAFLSRGIHVELEGDSNDYVGKGLSGGTVVIYPPKDLPDDYKSHENIIVGNVCLYGATSGKAYFRGTAAERFCVRNSGAVAIAEGIGDHGCEYMTGGVVIVLGPTGRNFAAGMSGGIAYVFNKSEKFESLCNKEMVTLEPVVKDIDVSFLQEHLKEFISYTGSEVAQAILTNWQDHVKYFVKVFPNEYRRALRTLRDEEMVKETQKRAAKKPLTNGVIGGHTTNGPTSPASKKSKKEPVVQDIESTIPDTELEQKIIDKALDKTRGFMKYHRQRKPYRPAETRLKDWGEIYNHQVVKKELKMQAARCMDCGTPFCQSHTGCPLGNIIPSWNDLVFKGQWKEALERLLATNNFPEFTGRCCPAPCEGACVLGINAPAVTIKNIECAIIDHAFEQGWITPQPPQFRTGKVVAVVGGGPSGLAAADQLNKAGHTVTVYERNDRVGGLLMYGIPTMKMSKPAVQRRVKLMEDEGVTFITNTTIGRDIDARHLLEKNDAVVMCTGATTPRNLPIPGRSLEGIYFAMQFLEGWQKNQMGNLNKYIDAKGKDVVVIGGGDTGCDCIGTSLRMDANSITSFEILTEPPPTRANDNPWPTWPRILRVDYGHEEVKIKHGQDPRLFEIMSEEFLDDGQGNVTGIRTCKVSWEKDEAGRWKMQKVPDSEKIFKADLVLLAMGFLGPEQAVVEQLGLDKDPRSNIQSPKGKYRTSLPKVFAAGDCHRGQSLVVHAINEGRQAAREVDLDLMGYTSLPGPGGVVIPATMSPSKNGVRPVKMVEAVA
ncbi:uncharacterized protein [Apostichopus japonicus]|uniref:uncharacterized protein n=1 Tax=Stichopus japonicus TaxID=307972 RepID=UPI003AB2B9B0